MEPNKRILDSHNVEVAQKPFKTLGHIFAKIKDPATKEQRTEKKSLKLSPPIGVTISAFVWKLGISTPPTLL